MAIFEDEFENTPDCYTPWTGTSVDAGNDLSCSSAQAKAGTYSSKHTLNDNYIEEDCYCYKTDFDAYHTIYMRFYVYLNIVNLPYTNRFCQLGGFSDGSSRNLGKLSIHGNSATAINLYLDYRDGTGYVSDDVGVDLNTGQWYCLEIKRVEHATTGEYEVWVDDSSKHNPTGLDTANFAHDRIQCGCAKGYRNEVGSNAVYYTDAVVVDTSYIGPISAAPKGNVSSVVPLMETLGMLVAKPFKNRFPKFTPRVVA